MVASPLMGVMWETSGNKSCHFYERIFHIIGGKHTRTTSQIWFQMVNILPVDGSTDNIRYRSCSMNTEMSLCVCEHNVSKNSPTRKLWNGSEQGHQDKVVHNLPIQKDSRHFTRRAVAGPWRQSSGNGDVSKWRIPKNSWFELKTHELYHPCSWDTRKKSPKKPIHPEFMEQSVLLITTPTASNN